LRVFLTLAFVESVSVPVVVTVKVDDFNTKHLARLFVFGVLSHHRVHVLDDTVRFLIVRDILGVKLELIEEFLGFTFIQNLFKKSILLQKVNRCSWVAVNLANNMWKLYTILLLGLIDHLIENAIPTNLKGTSLNLSALFSIRVSSQGTEFTTLGSLGDLLLTLSSRFFLLDSLGRSSLIKEFSEF
jgi:hypothetical protein